MIVKPSASADFVNILLCPNRLNERCDAEEVDDPREVIGEYGERHFGADILQALHQEVGCAHAHLDRAKRMFDGLPTLAHRLRVLIEPLLNSFQNLLVLPAADATLTAWCAARLE
jgi:hypothetical protein